MSIIAKCVKCRKEYEQIYCNNKFCALCKVLNEKKTTKAYNLRLSILKKSRIVKCKLCKKDTSGYYNRIYCESCKIIRKKICNQSTNIKKHLLKKSRIVQCKLCKKYTSGYYGKRYCHECKIIKLKINVKKIKPHLFRKSPIAQCKYCHKETQVYRGRPRQYCIDCIKDHTKIVQSKWHKIKTVKKIYKNHFLAIPKKII